MDRPRPAAHHLVASAFVAMLALGSATACGGDAAAAPPVFDVQLGRYTIVPGELAVPVGKVALRVTNVDSMVHSLVVASRGTRQLAPGQSETIEIDIEAGEYRMWCDVSGHVQLGQVGVLRSEAPAAPTTAAP